MKKQSVLTQSVKDSLSKGHPELLYMLRNKGTRIFRFLVADHYIFCTFLNGPWGVSSIKGTGVDLKVQLCTIKLHNKCVNYVPLIMSTSSSPVLCLYFWECILEYILHTSYPAQSEHRYGKDNEKFMINTHTVRKQGSQNGDWSITGGGGGVYNYVTLLHSNVNCNLMTGLIVYIFHKKKKKVLWVNRK